jgi:hypothetical protein
VRPALWVALGVAALGAAAGVYVTSERPDGLERVTQDLGLGGERTGDAATARAPAEPPAPRSRARRAALALVGALAVAGVALGAGRLLGRARRPRPPGGADAP